MKLKTQRMSGRPVSQENLQQYVQEWQSAYDAIIAEHGSDMLTVHQKVLQLEQDLNSKWQAVESTEVPKSAKAWKKLIEHYGAPVLLAMSAETEGELLLVIMDQPFA